MSRYLSACCVLDIIRHFQMLYLIAYQLKCDIMGIAQDLLLEVLDSDSTQYSKCPWANYSISVYCSFLIYKMYSFYIFILCGDTESKRVFLLGDNVD